MAQARPEHRTAAAKAAQREASDSFTASAADGSAANRPGPTQLVKRLQRRYRGAPTRRQRLLRDAGDVAGIPMDWIEQPPPPPISQTLSRIPSVNNAGMPPVCRNTTRLCRRHLPARTWCISAAMPSTCSTDPAGSPRCGQHRDRLEAAVGRDAVALTDVTLIRDEVGSSSRSGKPKPCGRFIGDSLRAFDLFRLAGADRDPGDLVRCPA